MHGIVTKTTRQQTKVSAGVARRKKPSAKQHTGASIAGIKQPTATKKPAATKKVKTKKAVAKKKVTAKRAAATTKVTAKRAAAKKVAATKRPTKGAEARRAPAAEKTKSTNYAPQATQGSAILSSHRTRKGSYLVIEVKHTKNVHASGTTTFGSVTIHGVNPKPALVKQNIRAGQQALRRAETTLLNAGAKINTQAGIPIYYADPSRPGVIIRKIGTSISHGEFVNGKFKQR